MAAPEIATISMTARIRVRCPFCVDRHILGIYEAGFIDGDEEKPALTHTLPPCPEFVQLDALDFLQASRAKLQQGGLPL